MTRKFIFLSLILMSSLLALAQPTITVAVASNMQYAMQELVAAYNQTNKTKIDIMMGASGNLTQQIMNGAPVDIFISADTVFPQKLAEHKLALTPPRVYARGVLVLWTVKPDIHPSKDLNLLLSNTIQTIAIANPGIAPYGNASLYLLKKRGLYDKLFKTCGGRKYYTNYSVYSHRECRHRIHCKVDGHGAHNQYRELGRIGHQRISSDRTGCSAVELCTAA